jgi:hypothetical protein
LNKFARITIKTVLWILASIIMLVVLVFVLIEVPAVQNIVRKKAVSFLENKIGTPVKIDRLSLDLPKQIVLEGVYFEDQRGDTLLAGDTLKVDISMLKLLKNQVEVNLVDLRGITANIQRTPDSAFNFDYITQAFVSQQKQPSPPPPDSTAAMKFSVSKINLDRIRMNYKDAVAASHMDLYLGHFDTDIKEFNLDSLRFRIPEIRLTGLKARVYQRKPVSVPPVTNETTPSVVKTSPASPTMNLKLGKIDLSRVSVDYRNDISAVNTQMNLGQLLLDIRDIDLKNQNVHINSMELNDTKALLAMGKIAKKAVGSTGETIANEVQKGWAVRLTDLKLAGNDIKFDDQTAKRLPRGIDYMHLNIRGLNAEAENILYSTEEISGRINSFSMRERSGLNLQQFRTNFFYGKNQAYLEDLYIQTPGTVIKDQIRLTYPSIDKLTTDPGSLGIEANLSGSRINTRDVLIFMPELANVSPFTGNRDLGLRINGRVSGKLSDLSIPDLDISGLTNTRIAASGRITGLPDMGKANFNITLTEFRSGRRDLQALVSKGMIPDNITVPESFRLSGSFRGTMDNFSSNMVLRSSLGSVVAAGTMQGERFNARVGLTNLEAGRLLKQEAMLGRISGTATVQGSGFDPEKMNASFVVNAKRAEIKGYPYRDFSAVGTIANQALTVKGRINDPNIRLSLNAKATGIQKTYPAIRMTASVDSADLHALNLYPENFRFRGTVNANLPSTNPDSLVGTVETTNLLLALRGERYQLDTIHLIATANHDQRTLNLRSEVMSAELKGRYRLTEIGNVFTNQINKYFKIGDGRELPVSSTHHFTFAAHITNRPVLQTLVPSLTQLETAEIRGEVNTSTGTLNMAGAIPQIVYMGYNLRNLKLDLTTDTGALNYSVNLDNATSSSLQLNKTTLSGKVQDNAVGVNLNVRDIDDKQRYRLLGTLSVDGPQYRFSFNPEGLLLNYQPWNVSASNALEFGQKGIMATNFTLSRNGQQLSVLSEPQSLNAPISIKLTNFQIETFTSIAQTDSLLAGGLINGTATVMNLATNPVFNADMKVANFTFMTDTVGDITFQVDNQTKDTFSARASITGNGNDIRLDGFYYTPPRNRNSFDLALNINTLNLASVEGFTMGSLKQASGTLAGNLKITGTPAAPSVRGQLTFNKAAFNVAMLNAFYRLDDQRINFTSRGIELNEFTLNDSIGNEAIVDGTLFTTNYLDYRFGLDVTTENFKALSSTAKDNDLFYGSVFVSSNLRIEGDMDAPSVDGKISVNKGTRFTVVLPTSDPAVQDREGVVEFVDMDQPNEVAPLTAGADTLNRTSVSGMDVSVNVEVDSNAIFSIIVDEGTGDFLEVQGEASLSAGIDPSGKISMTGNYTLSRGAYEMSYNFIRRRFDIERGSTITWTGEPTAANIDVTAIYVADTAPLELVDEQLTSTSEAERNRYKQRLPFEVYLTVRGEMLRPVISFDIDLPEGRNYNVANEVLSNVDTRLTQLRQEPNEMNKQVFSLLLLNRFSSDNPFDNNSGGGGTEAFVRQSVSRILNDQLNNLAGNIIHGVDINFNLVSAEDYTTGELRNRTDLNVGISKQLLNERLKVTIGNNFELEGPRNSSQGSSGIAGNIALDYQLSQDGRYMLRAYRKNVTDAIIEGYVLETGVGFIISMDYNKFRELFMRPSEEERKRRKEIKELRKREKEAQKQIAQTEK